jgi:hypothetical protein
MWSEGEISSGKRTVELLLEKSDFHQPFLSKSHLWLCLVNCKFRPEKTVDKFVKWTNQMRVFGINSFDDVHEGLDTEEEWNRLSGSFTAFGGCGLDNDNRSIMWIVTRKTPESEERDAIRCGALYFLAMHADLVSMREGITFVLDTTDNSMVDKVGNENKLQKVYQSIPLRPQHIFIIGAGWVKRALINAVISVISLFTKEKVIDRIRFATLEEVEKTVSKSSLPKKHGGDAGGIKTNELLVQYVKSRLEEFKKLTPDY